LIPDGKREYKERPAPKLGLAMNPHGSLWHFVVRPAANTKAITDLRGKRITTGKGVAENTSSSPRSRRPTASGPRMPPSSGRAPTAELRREGEPVVPISNE